MIKSNNYTLAFFLLILPLFSFAQMPVPLTDIMEEKFPSNIANSNNYRYKFLETNGQRQLIEISNPDILFDKWYCITDGTKENSTFYGEVNDLFEYFPDGDDFSFLRENPDNDDIIELLKYDSAQDTLLVSNSADYNAGSANYFTAIEPDLFAWFDRAGLFDYTLTVFEPSGSGFLELQSMPVPEKHIRYHPFISIDEYLYLSNNADDDLYFSKYNRSTAEVTDYGLILENSPVFSTDLDWRTSDEKYEALLIGLDGDISRPVVFNKETETLIVLDDIPSYTNFFNYTEFAMILAGDKLFIYNEETGGIEYYNLITSEKKSIPFPTRGAIEYDGRNYDYLMKGDSVVFLKRSPSLGWVEYFYYDEPNNELTILIDDYFASNGYGSRGGGMMQYDDKVILGFVDGFEPCGLMFLESDLSEHNFIPFPEASDFCAANLWLNDEKIIMQGYRNVQILDIDGDTDGFSFWNDCDDTDPMINPGAMEIPGNTVDENCDGIAGTTATTNLNELYFTVFPNPTSGLLKLDFGHLSQDLKIEVVNVYGEKVLSLENSSSTTLAIDFSDFPNGVYFIQANGDSGNGTVKIVKE